MKIPKIERRLLPNGLPKPETMKSCKQNVHTYHPDLWELEYCTRRYLERVSDRQLMERYQSIVRNMPSYTAPERNVVPIGSYQSSWYWYRKEHQTRIEIALRNIAPPTLGTIKPLDQKGEIVPNGTRMLYRYGKREFMRQMAEDGQIRFSPAETYDEDDNNKARKDDERNKHAFSPGAYVKITTEDGQGLPIIGDMQRTVTGTDYSLVCFSCVWDEQLFDEFEADTCVVIHDPDEFLNRISEAGKTIFPSWYYHDCPVQYFDPWTRSLKLESTFSS